MINPDSILEDLDYAQSVQVVTRRYRRRQLWDLLRGPMVAAVVHGLIIGTIAWRMMQPAAAEPTWTTVYVISGEDLSDGVAGTGDDSGGSDGATTRKPTELEPTESLADIVTPPALDLRPVATTLRIYAALRHPSPSTIALALLELPDRRPISRP